MHIGILLVALSIDAFAACIALGADGIRVPPLSALTVGAVGAGILAFSIVFSSVLTLWVPSEFFRWTGFGVFLVLGLTNLFENWIKSLLRKRESRIRQVRFSLFGIKFLIRVYLDETCADADRSKWLSVSEAVVFSLGLSADSFLTGLSAGATLSEGCFFVIGSLFLGTAAAGLGSFLGRKVWEKAPVNLSWITGALFCILAVEKLF